MGGFPVAARKWVISLHNPGIFDALSAELTEKRRKVSIRSKKRRNVYSRESRGGLKER